MISNSERTLLAAFDKLQQTLNFIEGRTIGANAADHMAEPTHIVSPLAKLKCLSEKQGRELAGRLRSSPAGQRPGLQSALSITHDAADHNRR
jgi:hypothetical protein